MRTAVNDTDVMTLSVSFNGKSETTKASSYDEYVDATGWVSFESGCSFKWILGGCHGEDG
jgi:hypothetical protein